MKLRRNIVISIFILTWYCCHAAPNIELANMWIHHEMNPSGAKYLFFSSTRSLKMREKYVNFEGSLFTFQFLNDEIHNCVKKTLTEQN